jgi:hypothetical protein
MFGLVCTFGLARAQEDDDLDQDLEDTRREPRLVLVRAIEAMGGEAAVRALKAAALSIERPSEESATRERHTLRLDGRLLHYALRGGDGVGFDVVLAGPQAFLCDRGPPPGSRATHVEDLAPDDAREAAYERDLLFMPLLLPALANDPAAGLEHKGRSSAGEEVIRAVVRPAPGNPGAAPFVIRLRFDATSGLLSAAMSIVPCGTNEGMKRYVEYREPKQVGALTLPHRYADQYGKVATVRDYPVAWTLDPAVEPALFARPTPTDGE